MRGRQRKRTRERVKARVRARAREKWMKTKIMKSYQPRKMGEWNCILFAGYNIASAKTKSNCPL